MSTIPPDQQPAFDRVVAEGMRGRAVLRRRQQGVAAVAAAVVLVAGISAAVLRGDGGQQQVTADGGTSTSTSVTTTTAAPTDGGTDEGTDDSVVTVPTETTAVTRPPSPACRPASRPQTGRLAMDLYGTDSVVVASLPATGGEPTILADYSEDAAWSPDGTRIAYVTDHPAGQRVQALVLMVADADGSDPVQLTSGFRDADPTWSPSGDRIAFQRGDPQVESAIYVIGVDGTGLSKLTDDQGFERGPAWSPDGTTIAFEAGSTRGLALMAPDGSNRRAIPLPTDTVNDPSWSADGKCIVFSGARAEAGAGGFVMNRIWSMRADGSDATQLTPSNSPYPQHDIHPSYSPDGASIVFGSNRPFSAAAGQELGAGVWLMGADGSSMRPLQDRAARPSWQPAP